MTRPARLSSIPAALFALTLFAPLALPACGGPIDGATGSSEARLRGPGGSIGGGPIGPIGGWAPIPVFPAKAFQAIKTTTSSVTLSWIEQGGNSQTILYRQLYDLAGNPTGSLEVLHTWTALAAGSMSYTDANASRKVFAFSKGGIVDYQPIQPDRMIGYQIVEVASGYNDCEDVPNDGYTCATSSTVAYTPGTVSYDASRAQLRIHVAQATAGASTLHLRAELSPYNATWLDSTHNDFSVGSNLTYDLLTDAIDTRDDIVYLDLWTPDPDGVCIDDVQLKIDDTTTFHESFATCRWVRNGSEEIFIPFAALRSSAEWQGFKPYVYLDGTPPVWFVGYDAAGLTSYLDANMGSDIKNAIPAPPAGVKARLGAPTSITRVDATHLHVQQHLVDIDTPVGTMSADPTYDLVIHHADQVCSGWCVRVENADGNANNGWANDLLDVVTLGIFAAVHGKVNGHLEDSLNGVTTSLPNPGQSQVGFCFAPKSPVPRNSPVPVFSSLFDDGVQSPFGEGSLTVCFYPASN